MKIIASSVEQFNEIKEKVKALPEDIQNQVEMAQMTLCGLDLEVKQSNSDEPKIFITTDVKTIKDHGYQIVCYTPNYLLRITGKLTESMLQYNFIQP